MFILIRFKVHNTEKCENLGRQRKICQIDCQFVKCTLARCDMRGL